MTGCVDFAVSLVVCRCVVLRSTNSRVFISRMSEAASFDDVRFSIVFIIIVVRCIDSFVFVTWTDMLY